MNAYQLKKARKQHPEVKVVNGRLVLSIGIDNLAFAAQQLYNQQAFDESEGLRDESEFRVSDKLKFAKSVAGALEREEEDGTKLYHIMFDAAFEYVLEQGEEGITERSPPHTQWGSE